MTQGSKTMPEEIDVNHVWYGGDYAKTEPYVRKDLYDAYRERCREIEARLAKAEEALKLFVTYDDTSPKGYDVTMMILYGEAIKGAREYFEENK